MKRLFAGLSFVALVVGAGYVYLRSAAALSTRALRHAGPVRVDLYPTRVDEGSSLVGETDHFRYHAWGNDSVPRWAMELHESVAISLCQILSIEMPRQIDYYKHPSQQSFRAETGSSSIGLTRPTVAGPRIDTVRRYHPHEVTHAVSHHLGTPPAFFDEGLATVFGWEWDTADADVHARALALLEDERLPPIHLILADGDFRRYKSYPAYTAAGSFFKYTLGHYGSERIRRLLSLGRYSGREEIEAVFESTYQRSIYDVEVEWKTALRLGNPSGRNPAPARRSETALTGVAMFFGVLAAGTAMILAVEAVFSVAAACARRAIEAVRGLRVAFRDSLRSHLRRRRSRHYGDTQR